MYISTVALYSILSRVLLVHIERYSHLLHIVNFPLCKHIDSRCFSSIKFKVADDAACTQFSHDRTCINDTLSRENIISL